jgi:transcriptional regulator with XRE-family HTH domain
MSSGSSTRHRPTDQSREAERLSQAIAVALGRAVKAGRLRVQLTQRALGARVGMHQAWISRIELGHGSGVPLRIWVALGVVLGRPLAISFTKPLGEQREPVDAGHLAMQERLLELAESCGRSASFELPTRPSDPSRSIDVCVRDGRNRVLLIQEAWNTFGDLGAAVRSFNRKTAEAAALAVATGGGDPFRVAAVWVVKPSAANRRLVSRYPHVFRSAFGGSSRAWVAALTSGVSPPAFPGLVWLDPATGRLTAWRRARATRRGA